VVQGQTALSLALLLQAKTELVDASQTHATGVFVFDQLTVTLQLLAPGAMVHGLVVEIEPDGVGGGSAYTKMRAIVGADGLRLSQLGCDRKRNSCPCTFVHGQTALSLALPLQAKMPPELNQRHETGLPDVCQDSVTSHRVAP
jgi:hypothetical protein